MTYRGHIENGLVVLDSPCPLPEGTQVNVVAAPGSPADARSKSHVELALEISASVPIEAWDTLPADGARNVDHYLYGAPRKEG